MGATYSNTKSWTVNLGLINFTSAFAITLKAPNGYRAKLREVSVAGTVLFTAVTTPAKVNVGSAENGGQYASCEMGTLAAKANYRMSDTAHLVKADIDPDTNFWVSIIAPTGGSPAGTGYVVLQFDLFY